jgi:hypothetical protein
MRLMSAAVLALCISILAPLSCRAKSLQGHDVITGVSSPSEIVGETYGRLRIIGVEPRAASADELKGHIDSIKSLVLGKKVLTVFDSLVPKDSTGASRCRVLFVQDGGLINLASLLASRGLGDPSAEKLSFDTDTIENILSPNTLSGKKYPRLRLRNVYPLETAGGGYVSYNPPTAQARGPGLAPPAVEDRNPRYDRDPTPASAEESDRAVQYAQGYVTGKKVFLEFNVEGASDSDGALLCRVYFIHDNGDLYDLGETLSALGTVVRDDSSDAIVVKGYLDTASFPAASQMQLASPRLVSLDGSLEFQGRVYNDTCFEFTAVAPYTSYRLICSASFTYTQSYQENVDDTITVPETRFVWEPGYGYGYGYNPWTGTYGYGYGYYGVSVPRTVYVQKRITRSVPRTREVRSRYDWNIPITGEGIAILNSRNVFVPRFRTE